MSYTYVDAPSHGFAADDKITFANLDGGTGIIEGTPYYVISSGLTADIFQFSETVGGAAFAFDDAIVSGDVSAWPTYSEASDGIQDPPTTPSAPDQPVLDSDSDTGVVRLVVSLTAITDARVRYVEVQITDEYDLMFSVPDAPIWTNAAIHQVAPQTTQFAVRAHPLTYYSARVRALDVYGNASDWTVAPSGPSANIQTVAGYDSINALASLESSGLDHEITETEIADDSISTPKLQAGVITAEKLASTIILGSVIVAGDPNDQHVELTEAGIILYDASDHPVVVIPTDSDQPVSVTGDIVAGTLTSMESAEFRALASLAEGATMTVQGSVVAPTAAPILTQGWDTLTFANNFRRSVTYFASGGAGGATAVFYGVNETTLATLYEYKASDGTVNRSKSLTSEFNTDFPPVAAGHGAYVYVLGHKVGLTTFRVARYNIADLSLANTYDSVSYPKATPFLPVMASDGTNLFIADVDTTIKWNKYDGVMTKVGSTIDTTSSVLSATRGLSVGNHDFGAWRAVIVGDATSAYSFDSTGAIQSTEEFPVPTGGGACWSMTYDGTRFWSQASYFPSGGVLTKHTTYTWTSGSDNHWVGYSWYDPDGTTHETAMGPTAVVALGKRKRLSVTNAAIPGAGGADDPDNVRIYALKNATDTGAGTFWLQTTDALTQRYLTTYTGAGTHDGAGTPFGAGAAAEFRSATSPTAGGWSLKGDGSILTGGTAFPASPATNQQFFRTDLGMWFFYDGTRWLSQQQFPVELAAMNAIEPYASTQGGAKGAATPSLLGGSDVYLTKAKCAFFVASGGTALSASHKWAGSLDKLADGTNSATALWTPQIDNGASSVWRVTETTLNVLQNNGTLYDAFQVGWTKTGTPGTLRAHVTLWYRIVAV